MPPDIDPALVWLLKDIDPDHHLVIHRSVACGPRELEKQDDYHANDLGGSLCG